MEGKKKFVCVSVCNSTFLSNAFSYLLGHCFEGCISVKTCPDDDNSIKMMNMQHWWNQGWPTSSHRSYVLESYYIC